MAIPTPSARLVFGGSMFDHTEIWSCSMGLHRWAGSAPLPDPSVLAPAIEGWFSASAVGISDLCLMEYIKLNEIDSAGHYKDETQTKQKLYGMPYPKGGRDHNLSNASTWSQITIAISLMTAAERGHAAKGRFFMPCPTVQAGPDGKIPAVYTNALAIATANMIDTMNTTLAANGQGWQISVLSALGAVRHVTGVRVGNVMDTQRRRRNAWPEVYTKAPLQTTFPDPGQVIDVNAPGGGG